MTYLKDVIEADTVEIQIDDTGKIWVNIDGRCALRIGHAKTIISDDPKRGRDIFAPTDELPPQPKTLSLYTPDIIREYTGE
jgi:hypothetical protein